MNNRVHEDVTTSEAWPVDGRLTNGGTALGRGESGLGPPGCATDDDCEPEQHHTDDWQHRRRAGAGQLGGGDRHLAHHGGFAARGRLGVPVPEPAAAIGRSVLPTLITQRYR